jgi:hypothetical protein
MFKIQTVEDQILEYISSVDTKTITEITVKTTTSKEEAKVFTKSSLVEDAYIKDGLEVLEMEDKIVKIDESDTEVSYSIPAIEEISVYNSIEELLEAYEDVVTDTTAPEIEVAEPVNCETPVEEVTEAETLN